MGYKNGFFQLVVKNGKTYVRLFPPKNGGARIDVKELADYLESENIFDYDINHLNQMLETMKEEVMEVEVIAREVLPAEEKMVFQVSDDRQRVVARFYPASKGGGLLNVAAVERLLNQRQIIFGIDTYEIRRFLHHRQYCVNYTIAKGTAPRHGEDAWIEYHFDTQKKAKPTLLEDGSVDFHQLDAINHVEKDSCLATLHPEDEGDAGEDVYGNKLPPRKVKRLYLKFGKNIRESEDKTQIFSNIDGHVRLEGDKIFVSDTYEVLGDVDASTGDIEYEGNVDIKGNVRTGFTVRASGDVNVKGVVEGASIYAGGKVVIQRGIQGMSKGYVECGGNLCSKFIENSKVKTSGEIITEAIMHSEAFAQGDVLVSGKKGLITGGRVCSRSLIDLKIAGSDMGTVTKLEVGADPEVVERCHWLAKQLPDLQRDIDTNQKKVDMFTKKIAAGDKLSPEKMATLKEAKLAVENATKEFQNGQKELEQLQEEIMANSNGMIKVQSLLYPGVEVTIADVQMHVRTETKYCRLVRDGADIRVQAY